MEHGFIKSIIDLVQVGIFFAVVGLLYMVLLYIFRPKQK